MTDDERPTSTWRSVLRRGAAAVPPGTLAVGGGVVGLGLSAYLFLVLAGRGLGVERFATLSVLWVLVYTFGPGLFVPLEQEVARAVAARRALGTGSREIVRLAALIAAASAAAVTLCLLVASPVIVPELLDGSVALLAVLVLAVWGLCAAHLVRGVLSGTGRFRVYGLQLGLEGALRAALCGVLVLAGVATVLPYGLLLGLAVLLAVGLTGPTLRGTLTSGHAASGRELSSNLVLLLTASLLSQAIANAGPVVVRVAADGEQALAGQFLAGFVIARVPMFLFASVQAALLPQLSALAAAGHFRLFRRALGRILLVVSSVGVVGLVGAAAVGPQVLRAFFGPGFDLGRTDMALLALGSGLFMLAVVLAQAHVALGRHRSAAAGWVVGALVLAVVTWLVDGALPKAEWGFVAGCGGALLVLAALLDAPLRQPTRPEAPAPLTAPGEIL